MITSNEIRKQFLDFFEGRGHRVVRSSSLVPAHDPTLLFANAGMNQFKDVFLGREKRPYTRACSSQKCVRAGGKHNDLEQVGRTTRHHTFFEMLGNFSFGDYFKHEAIPWAWELVTQGFGLPAAKLYATVFREDDEAEDIWAKIVPRQRIFRFDEKDNFWQMGETGPCGPCSEIHYDLGPGASDLGHQDCPFPCPDDCGRYVEIWNLVFMQFNRDEQGNLTPLPRPSIDTGAGLERFATALQGKTSNFDTDLFRPLIEEAAGLANVEYGANHDTDVSLRIIADHSRAATFLISDGVLPSNEGRGYVLRLILRRALYHGQTVGLNEPFLYRMAGHVVQMMKDAYPELLETEHHIAKAIKIEEERFAHTTRVGLVRLEETPVWGRTQRGDFEVPLREYKRALSSPEPVMFWEIPEARPSNRQPVGGNLPICILGEDLFKLHDTYGLRPDFVEDVIRSLGIRTDWFGIFRAAETRTLDLDKLPIDSAGYEAAMEDQRERARVSWLGGDKKAFHPVYLRVAEKLKIEFLGYQQTTASECRVLTIVLRGSVQSDEVTPGTEAEIVLDRTPFYAEAGGQVGDAGRFVDPTTAREVGHVYDTYSPVTGVIVHRTEARQVLRVGDIVTAVVDAERRDAIRRNHTATHLLHAALRRTLGTHVKQAGSLVAPDRFRFDFTHYAALDEQDLLDIEDLVNQRILANEPVETQVMELDAAVGSGAMALFGEKYADRVRVVSVDDFSKELCGGTHVRRTGDIGLFKILSESSVAAGTRRIEGLTGEGVLKHLREASGTLALLSQVLRAKPDELLPAAEKLSDSEKKLRKQLESQRMKRAAAQAGDLLESAREVKGVRVISSPVEAMDRPAMRKMIDNLRGRLESGVIVLGSVVDGKVSLVAAVTKDLTNRLDAGKIVKEAAALVEGSGGGRKDLAEAGGKDPAKLDEALQAVPGIVRKLL
jgi:alanyl-tRNA synthetase